MSKSFLLLILMIPQLAMISAAKGDLEFAVDGSESGYRKLQIEIYLEVVNEERDLEIWIGMPNANNTTTWELHSIIFARIANTTASTQPDPGTWYDDGWISVEGGIWEPIRRNQNGSALAEIVGAQSAAIRMELTGMPSGKEVRVGVLDHGANASRTFTDKIAELELNSINAISSAVDDAPPPPNTSPVLFAIGSIGLSLIALLATFRWLDAKDGRTSSRSAHLYIAPALLALTILTFYPVIYGMWLGFTDADRTHLGDESFVGLANYIEVFTASGFLRVTTFTLIWTVVNVAFHVGLGLVLALILNQPNIRGRVAYRTALLLPWAVPSYISVLIWKGMLQPDGILNDILGTNIDFLSNPSGARTVVIMVNIWLGVPFMMMSLSGALQSIPTDMHEAARVDGIGSWSRFRHLTLPHLKSAIVPLSLLGFIWTFNMFNVIYLLTDGGPNLWFGEPGSTDILITYVYDVAFREGAYGIAAAWSVVIFMMLLSFSWIYMRKTSAMEAVS